MDGMLGGWMDGLGGREQPQGEILSRQWVAEEASSLLVL